MSTSQNKLEEILDQARRLPEDQRQRLVADLQADKSAPSREARRQNSMERWLARAGTGHADATDISGRKNEYLTKAFATKP